jgi:hypothetical protein
LELEEQVEEHRSGIAGSTGSSINIFINYIIQVEVEVEVNHLAAGNPGGSGGGGVAQATTAGTGNSTTS